MVSSEFVRGHCKIIVPAEGLDETTNCLSVDLRPISMLDRRVFRPVSSRSCCGIFVVSIS